MNILLDVCAAGIFSKVMFVIQNLATFKYQNVHINCIDDACTLLYTNPFDYVFEQPKVDASYERHLVKNLGSHTYLNKIEMSQMFTVYKDICKRFTLSKDLDDLLWDHRSLVNHDSIGIHVRLTDMNMYHKVYGIYTIDDYLILAESLIRDNNKNLFVASDNNESLERFKSEFGERVKFAPGLIRCKKDDDNSSELQYLHLYRKRFWLEAFLEMLLLSKCETVVCRTSNLSNVSKLFSTREQRYIWLPIKDNWDWKPKRRRR